MGGWQLLLAVGLIPVVGFALHSMFGRPEEVLGELHIWVLYGLSATGIVFLTIFLWNLLCAPYRIMRDKFANLVETFSAAETDSAKSSRNILVKDSYSIGLVSKLLGNTELEQQQLLLALKDEILCQKLATNINDGGKFYYRLLRCSSNPKSEQLSYSDVLDTFTISRKSLLKYLTKHEVPLPEWLQESAEEPPN